MGEELRIEYVPLSEVRRWPRNPKKHDMGALVAAIERYGFVDPPKFDQALGALVYGNGRDEALEWMKHQGRGVPRGIKQRDDGEWLIPVKFGVDTASVTEAEALAIDHNNLTMSGGDFTPFDMARMWDGSYVEILESLRLDDALPLTLDEDALRSMLEQAGSELLEGASNQIVGHSQGYDFRDIHAGKLAYRVEAAWRSAGALAIDLYSGQGQLATWYQRRFDRVIRIDQEPNEELDYVASAVDWLRSADFAAVAGIFDFIDFDDEGSPLRAVKALFEVLPKRDRPFVLCVTDGSGLNLKLHGQFNPALYGLEGAQRRATTGDYEQFDGLVQGAINAFASSGGYTAQQWSSVRGSENNVVYQTYLIERSEQG